MVVVTVRELWRFALPARTRLVAGERGLDREVSWATTLRTRAPVFPSLQGKELALLSLASLKHASPEIGLGDVIGGLAERDVAAIAVVGDLPAKPAAVAEATGIPLFELPSNANLRELESNVVRLIAQRRTELYQWGLETQHLLTEISLAGQGIAGMVEGLARFSGRTVAFLAQDLHVRLCRAADGAAAPEDIAPALAAAERELAGLRRAAEWLPTPSGAGQEPANARIALGPWAAWVSAIAATSHPSGYLAVIAAADQLGERERIAATRGAMACALELAKERAVAEVESRLRGDFLDQLLEGRFDDEEALLERARHLGCDLSQPHVVLVLEPDTATTPEHLGEVVDALSPALAGTVRGSSSPLLRARNGRVTGLYPVTANQGSKAIGEAVAATASRLAGRWPGVSLSTGLGRRHPGLAGLRTSHREAEQALTISRSLFGRGCTVAFGDLGAYRLLFLLQGNPEVQAFYRETLGQLADYDAKNHTELLRTLETFFACQGNLQNTAEALFLHRNSLAYRLRRAQELSGLHLDDLEDRFLLHLALKIRRTIS